MKTITFYSYKGGVGRSLALVNIATRLSEFGKKVCVIDFDLEAPGLHIKFPINRHILEQNYLGIVDFVYKFANEGILDDSIEKYTLNVTSNKDNNLILIPAGNINSSDYWKKLSSLNWYDLIYENPNGVAFFFKLKELIEEQIKPDFLLIDSRTGISESSGINLSLLADEVVILAANNKENLNGASRIIKSLSNPDRLILEKSPKLTFVLSRVPFTNKIEDRNKENILINRIKREYLQPYIHDIHLIHSDRELEELEKVKMAYEKDDTFPQISLDYLSLFESLTQNDLSNEEINKFKDIKNSERYLILSNNSDSPAKKLEYINVAISYNASNIELFFHRALINYESMNYDDSLNDLEKVLKEDDHHYNAILFKAEILSQLERLDEGLEIVNKYLRIFPTDDALLIKKSTFLYKKNKLVEAEGVTTLVIEQNPELSVGYACRGNIRRVMKKFREALNDIFKALELDSDNIQAVATLAEVYAETDNYDEFFIHFENVLKRDKEYIKYALKTERIYRKFEHNQRFISMLNKYGLYYPENVE
ncbi:hypothetical protein D1632_12575 [Chryseobacterium nematophagum]|uniref:AAA domain-containing protein n=1 Tax=Chryseobacterium nematophagum TaxID=2305228 RepID=A0A3M7L8B0_9FLAO|nr:tetratricopeptide repeat protein [Chryseobacterium nematophagum]RMZ58449.1 hypothetical protein D1632_12575 [Chryseobacterium nematophagum]